MSGSGGMVERARRDEGPDACRRSRFAAWLGERGGYVVLDLWTGRPVAGPFSTPREVLDAAGRWNRWHRERRLA